MIVDRHYSTNEISKCFVMPIKDIDKCTNTRIFPMENIMVQKIKGTNILVRFTVGIILRIFPENFKMILCKLKKNFLRVNRI